MLEKRCVNLSRTGWVLNSGNVSVVWGTLELTLSVLVKTGADVNSGSNYNPDKTS